MKHAAAIAFLVLAGVASADQGPQAAAPKTAAPNAAAPNSVDRHFMTDAAADGMAEVALGRLATEKAASPDVKSFGQMMVDDHTRANAELSSLAAAKSVDLPEDMKPEHKAAERKLRELSGAEFDSAYMTHMVKDHEKAVRAFTRQSTSGGDADLKGFAGRTLPTLRQHLERARELASDAGRADEPRR